MNQGSTLGELHALLEGVPFAKRTFVFPKHLYPGHCLDPSSTLLKHIWNSEL